MEKYFQRTGRPGIRGFFQPGSRVGAGRGAGKGGAGAHKPRRERGKLTQHGTRRHPFAAFSRPMRGPAGPSVCPRD